MAWGRLLLLVLCVAELSVRAEAQAPSTTHWCAEPRPEEPLLRDARGLANPDDAGWATSRAVFDIPLIPSAKIDVIRDEALCRRSAVDYGDHMRSVADERWTDKPVLVLRVGDMYLVDDQRSRKGVDAYWTVLLFSKDWKVLYEYGGGS